MKTVRKIVLKILKRTAFDVTIKHHLTKNNFLLNTYLHKGYWYYGKKREKNTIKIFRSWIKPQQYVLEIGGHIGYFTTLYAEIVGKKGKIDVFEPGKDNIIYLNKNIKYLPIELQKIITVINKGAGDVNGLLDFYIDPITGQNNSFVKNFERFFLNREKSADNKKELINDKALVTTLDTYFENKTKLPDFVKIDVEGFEWNVIQGFLESIDKKHPQLMIEIQLNSQKLINLFKEKGYTIYNDEMDEIKDHDDYLRKKTPNIFFRHPIPSKIFL